MSTSSRLGRLCLFFSKRPKKSKGKGSTLADVLAFLGDLVPGVEAEVGRVVDGLPGDLSVVFVVEGQHSAQE